MQPPPSASPPPATGPNPVRASARSERHTTRALTILARVMERLRPNCPGGRTGLDTRGWPRLRRAVAGQHGDDEQFAAAISTAIHDLHANSTVIVAQGHGVNSHSITDARADLDRLREHAEDVSTELRRAIRVAHRIAKRVELEDTPLRRALGAWLIRLTLSKATGREQPQAAWRPHLPTDAAAAPPRAAAAFAHLMTTASPWGTPRHGIAGILPTMVQRAYRRDLAAVATGRAPAPRPHAMDPAAMIGASPLAPDGKADDRNHRQQTAQVHALELALAAGYRSDAGTGLNDARQPGDAPKVDPVRLVLAHRRTPCDLCEGDACPILKIGALASAAPLIFFGGRRPAAASMPTAVTYQLDEKDTARQATCVDELRQTGRAEPCPDPRVITPTFMAYRHRYAESLEAAQAWFSATPQGARAGRMNERVGQVLSSIPPTDAPWDTKTVMIACAKAAHSDKGRLVFDHTRLNERSCAWPMTMCTIEEILMSIKPGSWVASDDVTAGFHHMEVAPADRPYMAFVHLGDGKTYQPTRVMFGNKCAPAGFSTVSAEATTSAQRYINAKMGPDCGVFLFVYVDDIFTIASSEADCRRAQQLLQEYCESVGIELKAAKRREPAQDAPLLGLRVDSVTMTVYLPEDKRYNILFLVQLCLQLADRGQCAPLAILRKAAGKLAHFLVVFPEGRAHLAPLYAACESGASQCDLRTAPGALSALRYWSRVLCDDKRGVAPLVSTPTSPTAPPWVSSYSDAAGDGGYCLTIGPIALWGTWLEGLMSPFVSIGLKEIYPLALLQELAGDLLDDIIWTPRSDNLGNCFSILKGYTDDKAMRPWLASILASRRAATIPGWLPREFNTCNDDGSKAATMSALEAALAKYCTV